MVFSNRNLFARYIKWTFFSVCMDCDCLICNACILSTHNGHTLGKIKNASETSREITRNIIEDLKSKVNVTSDMLKKSEQIKYLSCN